MWIIWTLGGLFGLAILFMAFLQIWQMVSDRRGKQLGRDYLSNTGFECIEIKLYSGHYRLFFRAEGKRMHANYRVHGDQIDWTSGTPEERAQQKSKNKNCSANQMSHESPYSYPTGEPVLVGDQVRIRRTAGSRLLELLRSGRLPARKWTGEIIYVYDPNKPSQRWGDNQPGLSIKLPNGDELFDENTNDLYLISRSQIEQNHRADQAGSGQPATRSESDPEGGDNPQPGSEERSR